MIIFSLCNLLISFFDKILIIEIPEIPADMGEYVEYIISTMSSGVVIIAQYTNLPYLVLLFQLAISIEAVYLGYKVLMWILKKVPFVDIS